MANTGKISGAIDMGLFYARKTPQTIELVLVLCTINSRHYINKQPSKICCTVHTVNHYHLFIIDIKAISLL